MLRLALLVVAGCGRIAFDPLGEGGPGGDGGMTTGDGGSVTGDGGAADATPVTCASNYASGSTIFVNGTTMTAQIGIPATSTPNTLIVVQIHWAANTGSVSSVTDTRSNTYSAAANIVGIGTTSQIIYTAPLQIGAAGTMTVTFAAPVPNPDITFGTFTGVDLAGGAAAMPVGAGGLTGTSPATTSTNVTATATLVAALTSGASSATAGAGFQKRAGTSGSMLMDRCAGAGAHNATASLSASSNWILHMIALRSL